MTERDLEQIEQGDTVYVDEVLVEDRFFDELATAQFKAARQPIGTKLKFVKLHDHVPEFLIAETNGEQSIYHYSELLKRQRIIVE